MQNLLYLFSPVLIYISCSFLGTGIMMILMPTSPIASLLGTGAGAALMLGYVLAADRTVFPSAVKRKNCAWWLIPAGLLCGSGLSYLSSAVMNALDLYSRFSNEAQTVLLQGSLILQVMILGILVPIAEEITYRGIFLSRLQTAFPRWAAVLICSMAFALGHGNMIQFLYAFPMGLLLAAAAVKSRGLLLPIAIHIGANLFSVWMTYSAIIH